MDETYLRNEVSALVDLLVKKNTDYGNSFDKAMEKFGGISLIVMLFHKFGRLETIFDSKQIFVADEGVEDTINDIIGYCLLYKHYCMSKRNDEQYEEWGELNEKAGIKEMNQNEMKKFYDKNYTKGDDK